MKYTIDEINIGDEVIFNSTRLQSNHDEFWKVTGKSGNRIQIELKKFGFNESWSLDVEEIIQKLPGENLG